MKLAKTKPDRPMTTLAVVATGIALMLGLACKQEQTVPASGVQVRRADGGRARGGVHSSSQRAVAYAPSMPAAKADGGEVRNNGAKCVEICRIPSPLHCKNARQCKEQCESMASLPVCAVEMGKLFDCLLRQPLANWECDEEGIGAIRDPYCDKEQGLLAKCIDASASP